MWEKNVWFSFSFFLLKPLASILNNLTCIGTSCLSGVTVIKGLSCTPSPSVCQSPLTARSSSMDDRFHNANMIVFNITTWHVNVHDIVNIRDGVVCSTHHPYECNYFFDILRTTVSRIHVPQFVGFSGLMYWPVIFRLGPPNNYKITIVSRIQWSSANGQWFSDSGHQIITNLNVIYSF